MRPLQLEFEQDMNCRDVMHEYLLGRDLMVSIYKPDVYLPAGRWRDFWTGRVYEGGRTHSMEWPATRGGGLFLREGAIVPFGPLMQYRGEKPVDHIELMVFPGAAPSTFDLYEDDGVSFDYRDGKCAVTRISCTPSDGEVTIEASPPEGDFAPPERQWALTVALDKEPKSFSGGEGDGTRPPGTEGCGAEREHIEG